MQKTSSAKVKKVLEMMKLLHLRVEAREKMNPQGFIERIVFWVDDEQYPLKEETPAEASATTTETPPAPTGATGPNA